MKKSLSDSVSFKIKFSNVIIILCAIIFLLCGVGIALSIWRIYRFGVLSFTDVLKYPFLIAVCLFCIALVISILIKSQYLVDKTYVILQYGFIKTKLEIKTMTALTLDVQAQKLTIDFGEQFMVLSVSEKWSDKFVRAILDVNPEIEYSFTLSDVPELTKKDDDNDKKED